MIWNISEKKNEQISLLEKIIDLVSKGDTNSLLQIGSTFAFF